jgi:hypothetical protein
MRNTRLIPFPTHRRSTGLALIAGLLAVFFATGCASTRVVNREQLVTEQLPRPAHILIYDFVATPGDLPADSALKGQLSAQTQTPEDIQLGRQLGSEIATQLAQEIFAMGLPAEHATRQSRPQINDIVIRGYLLGIEEGSAAKRITIGFGSGGSKLTTTVEGFQMTASGLRKLGSGTTESGGNKTPGAGVGLVAFIATANPVGLVVSGGVKVYDEASGKSTIQGRAQATAKEIGAQIKPRFQQQGWIQ